MSFVAVAIGGAALISAGVGVYEGSQQQGIANQQLGLEQTTQSEQMQSYNQLQTLMNNPSSFFSSPVYQAAFGQGTQAVARSNAAGGFLNSGNAATALQSYGQSFGQSQLLSQEQLLASMSGTTNASSPSQAGAAASSANSAAYNQFGGVLASLGYSASNYGGSGGTIPGGGGSTMDAGGGYTFSY